MGWDEMTLGRVLIFSWERDTTRAGGLRGSKGDPREAFSFFGFWKLFLLKERGLRGKWKEDGIYLAMTVDLKTGSGFSMSVLYMVWERISRGPAKSRISQPLKTSTAT